MAGENAAESSIENIPLVGFIYRVLTSYIFIANWVLAYLWFLHSKRSIRPLIIKSKEDRERDQKYLAFKRNDMQFVENSTFWTYLMLPLLIPRMIGCYFSIAVSAVICQILACF